MYFWALRGYGDFKDNFNSDSGDRAVKLWLDFMFLHESYGTASGILTQKHGDHHRPIITANKQALWQGVSQLAWRL